MEDHQHYHQQPLQLGHDNDDEVAPEPSPRGPPEPEQPTPAMPSEITTSRTATANNHYVLLENLPHGISQDNDDGSCSILSLPHVPSPVSKPSPSLFIQQQHTPYNSNSHNHPTTTRRVSSSASPPLQRTTKNDEEDTFFDDRSLEVRIEQTLSHGPPQLWNYSLNKNNSNSNNHNHNDYSFMNTPASIPVTPGSTTHAHRHHQQQQHPTAFDFSSQHHHKSPGTTNNNNNNIQEDAMQSHRSAMAIQKLKEDLEHALQQLSLYKQEKQAAEAQAQDWKRQNEELLKEQRDKASQEEQVADQNTNPLPSPESIQTVQDELNVARQAQEDLQKRLTNAQDELATKCQEHTQEQQRLQDQHQVDQYKIQTLQEALEKATKSSDNSSDDNKDDTALEELQQNLAQKEEELQKAKAENETQLVEIQRLIAELGELKQQQHSTVVEQPRKDAECQTTTTTATTNVGDASIQDRLLRIRDASERVALVKEHHNEMTRLKAQHESQIKDLMSLHEASLQERLDQETSQLEAQHKEALERVRTSLEYKIGTLERRHRQEVQRFKEEMNTNNKISDESLQVATAKAASLKQRLDREITKREQLQQQVSSLEEQLAFEKKRLTDEHLAHVESLQRKWSEEKTILLNVIQRDCNQVFDRNRHKSQILAATSPKSVVMTTMDRLLFDDSTADERQESPRNESAMEGEAASSVYAEISPRYSDMIDQELRETEALVQTLLLGST